MNRNFILAFFAVSAIFFGISESRPVVAQSPLLVEDFAYSAGQLTTVSGATWVNFSGTGNFIQVSNGGLTYTGYPSSGIGNKIDIISVGTSAEDAHRQFATQGTGTTTYTAFMVNVANTTGLALNSSTTGDYFAGFLPSSSTTALNARVSIRLGVTAGTYQLGLRATSSNTATAFSTTDLNPGTTYLVVISCQLVAGNSNDPINMWINPAIGGSEPSPNLTQTTASTTDNADIARFFVRQGTTTTPNASIDGVRVGNTWASVTAPAVAADAPVDMNGDGKTDFLVVRNTGGGPSGQITWFTSLNGGGGDSGSAWGIASDFFVSDDFDGDGKDDIAVWRPGAATVAAFYILQSATSTVRIDTFGQTGDDPTVVGDYDGDGKADVAVYRGGAAAGNPSTWYYRGSLTMANVSSRLWGQNGDFPAPGDYDGDGMNDFVIQRNNGGGQARFWRLNATGTIDNSVVFGTPTDVIVPGDYDGDGKTDVATVRGVGGAIQWQYLSSVNSTINYANWGASATDFACQGDFNGDGRTDFAIWRPNADPAQNYYWVYQTNNGAVQQVEWGQNGDYPVNNFNTH